MSDDKPTRKPPRRKPATTDEVKPAAPTRRRTRRTAVPEPWSGGHGIDTEIESEDFEMPADLAILPLRNVVVFPGAVLPLAVGRQRSLRLLDDLKGRPRLVGLLAQRDEDIEEASADECYTVGTVARVARIGHSPDGVAQIIVQGLQRFVVTKFLTEEPFLRARVRPLVEKTEKGDEIDARARAAADLFQRLGNLVNNLPDQLVQNIASVRDNRQVVNMIAGSVQIDLAQRQAILEEPSLKRQLDMVILQLTREVELLDLARRIHNEAQEEMNKTQRDYFLREQIKAIQRELGEEGDDQSTLLTLREKLEEAHLPEEARREVMRELSRLERIPTASPEYSVIRTYVELVASLPWNKGTSKPIDIAYARQVLNEDHYDLERIKDRILEYLAVRKLRLDRRAAEVDAGKPSPAISREPILCFAGPPGVGKTSLGQSIARAMGRSFIRVSLGGVHDEAEVRGHRRTYIGAMPGRILQAIRRAGTNDPVFMLDEVDKLTQDWRGDPSAALLEVLDPEQNHSFRDNYLDLPFDLSKVMFIATANALDPIPAPLRDRMEVLELSGYTEVEKVEIARRHLVPKQITANALHDDEIEIGKETLQRIVRGYTREAGVRNLEREIGTVCRKVARNIAERVGKKTTTKSAKIVVTPDRLREFLGRPRFFDEVAERINRPGIVTGLAWTPSGGDIMFIEAAMSASEGAPLALTGKLGDVMKESAHVALAYVKSNAKDLGTEPNVFDKQAIHIHVPEGAIPKDGPSAGITIMTALASLATGRKARSDVAMTGELSLRGKVLPIGGLKEKVLAAHRAGLHTVIIPRPNESDLEDLPDDLRSEMHFIPVDDAREVLEAALEPIDKPVRSSTAARRAGEPRRKMVATQQ